MSVQAPEGFDEITDWSETLAGSMTAVAVAALEGVVTASLNELEHGNAFIHPSYAACLEAMAGNPALLSQWFYGTDSWHEVRQGDILAAVRNSGSVAVTVDILANGQVMNTIRDLAPGTTEWVAEGTPLNVATLVYSDIRVAVRNPDQHVDVLFLMLNCPLRMTAMRDWCAVVHFPDNQYLQFCKTLVPVPPEGVVEHEGRPVSTFARRPSLRVSRVLT